MKEKKEEETKSIGNEKVAFYKLFSFADRRDVSLMVVGSMAAIVNGLMKPMMAYVFGQLVDAFGQADRDNVLSEVSQACLNILYLAVAAGIASFLQVSCWMISGERQAARIRILYLSNILRQDIAFFDNETTTGEVVGRMAGDTIFIQEAIGEKVGKCIQLFANFFGGFIVAFAKGWLLTVVMLSSIPPIVIAGTAMSLTMSKLSSRSQKAYAEAGTVVEQTVGSIRTVASFTGEKKAIETYIKLVKGAYRSTVHEGAASGLGVGCVTLIVYCSYGLATWYGSKLTVSRGYNGGEVITVLNSVMSGATCLGQTSPCISAFAAGQAAAFKMFETINRKPNINVGDTSGIVLEEIKGDIELKDIYFSYPERPDHVIFDGFSLYVSSGTTMALVGESGSGKSTVVSLVERFYDPLSGEVLIDGVNLKKLRLRWIREKVGLVSQEPILFTTSIRENIAYGKDGATDEEIRRAMELANAAKFIDKMPSGLDTMVGEHGTQLSGGQKQRIAIARAILKNPKILLLDEATSALDAESERIVQGALVRIMVDRTTIIVAHHLSTVKNADSISVVHRGKLIEQGPHSELMKDPDGAYSQLIRLQEINTQPEEVLSHVTGKLASSSSADAAKSFSRSTSQRISFKRFVRNGSSIGGSSRLSITLSVGLPDAIELQEEGTSALESAENENDEVKEARKRVSFRRLAYLNKSEIPILLLGTVVAVINGAIFPVFGIVLSNSMSSFYKPPHELLKDARFWTLMYVVLGIAALLVAPVQNFLFGVAGGKLVERIRSLSFERMVYQEISWFDEPSNSSGAMGARLSADASAVKSLVGDNVALIVQNITTLIAGLLIAMIANCKLTLVIFVLFPLVGLQGYAQMKSLKGFSADAKVMYEEGSQVASDAVSSIRTVASFCAEQKVIDNYEKKCEAPLKHGVRQGIISGSGFGFSNTMLFCTHSLFYYVAAHFVHNGSATFGQVFKVFFALNTAALGISQSSAFSTDSNKAKDSAASIFAILDRKSKIDSSVDEGTKLASVRGDVEFKHVSFKYPTRSNVQIFRDLCLSVPFGKTLALVGESGSGKSTVISLLERFYDPDSGTILLDGVEIQKFNINWLRQQMGLVNQEPLLFGGTIRSNIAYGKKEQVTEDEIIAACEAANAHHFISNLPHGYDTDVGERGVQLSGGQKQRIAIARAIIKDPRILLLDEATSALDVASERVVQEALDRVMMGRTTVVVAHRLATIQGADTIAVVKNGVIAERGRHEELMNLPDGAYASLVAFHSSSKTLDESA